MRRSFWSGRRARMHVSQAIIITITYGLQVKSIVVEIVVILHAVVIRGRVVAPRRVSTSMTAE